MADSALSALTSDTSSALAAGKAARATQGLTGKNANPAAVQKSAQDFEAFFASQMLSSMFEGIKTDSFFGGGHGEDMFRSVMLDEYGKEIAKKGALGIANSVMKTMLQQQEVGS